MRYNKCKRRGKMSEDVKDILASLTSLYDKGKKASERMNEMRDSMIPNRFFETIPRPQFSWPYEYEEKKPQPEHFLLTGRIIKFREYIDRWNELVLECLKKLGSIEYEIRFQEGSDHGFSLNFTGMTERESKFSDMISDFESQVVELRAIIFDIERESRKATSQQKNDKITVCFDKQKKVIVLGNAVIGFNKNNKFSKQLCEIIINQPKKLWTIKELQSVWDPNYEYVGCEKPSDWQRVCTAIRQQNEKIRKKTAIEDLFVLTTKEVTVNKKYLAEK